MKTHAESLGCGHDFITLLLLSFHKLFLHQVNVRMRTASLLILICSPPCVPPGGVNEDERCLENRKLEIMLVLCCNANPYFEIRDLAGVA